MTPEMQALTRRLEEVERQVAHLEALVVEHSDSDRREAVRTVKAETFTVTDKDGVRRAELGMSVPAGETEEHPWLGLFDADGNVRACLGVHEGLPWLEFYDANQKSVVNLRVDEHRPQMSLHYGNGGPAVVIKLLDDGPGIILTGPNGQESLNMSVWQDGPHIMLSDTSGKPAASLGGWQGRRSLVLYGPSGKVELKLQIALSGTKELFIGEYGSEAQPTVGPSLKLEVTDDGPCLKFGKDNKVFWSAP